MDWPLCVGRMTMELRSKIQSLLEVPELPKKTRQVLTSVLETAPLTPLEETMTELAMFHTNGLYQWYYKPNGDRRQGSVATQER